MLTNRMAEVEFNTKLNTDTVSHIVYAFKRLEAVLGLKRIKISESESRQLGIEVPIHIKPWKYKKV